MWGAIHIARHCGDRFRAIAVVLFCLLVGPMSDGAASPLILPPALPSPFAGAISAGPYNFECTDDENLRLTTFDSLAGVTVRVVGRIKRPDGRIGDIDQSITPSSDRVANVIDFPLGAGYLLNVTAYASAGSPKIGQTFTRLQLIRGRTGATMPIGTLVQGYVTGNQDRAWPGSMIESSIDGNGFIRVVDGTKPAAGVNVVETVPTGARWELLAFRADFTTSAAGAARGIRLFLNDGVAVRWRVAQPTAQAPSTVISQVFAPGLGAFYDAASFLATAALPIPVPLSAGWLVQTAVTTIDVADQWDTPRLTVREWLEAQ